MKPLEWIGSSKKEVLAFPEEVRKGIGYALYLAQNGMKHPDAKLFKGHGLGVFEIVVDFNKNAYRSIYTISIKEKIFVIHCFKKKSKIGIKTPKEELEVIKSRLKFLRTL